MAVTFAQVGPESTRIEGNKRVGVRTVTLDSSYVQTGEPVSATDFGLGKFETLEPLGLAIPSAGTTAWTVTAQVASTGLTALLFVHGQEPSSATATTIALADADSTEDLSTFSVVMKATGY